MNLLNHVGDAASLISYQNFFRSSLAGDRSDLFAALHQALAIDTVFSVLGTTLSAFQRGPVPLIARGVCYLTPIVLSFAIGKSIQSDRCRRALILAQDAIGPLCQVAFVVCLATSAYFGVATVSLTLANGVLPVLVLLQFLEQRDALGQWLGEKVRNLSSVIESIKLVSATSLLNKGIGALNFLGIVMKARSSGAHKAKKPIDNALKLADLKKLIPFWKKAYLTDVGTINRDYIHFETLPPANPNTQLDAFNTLLQTKLAGLSKEKLLERIRVLLAGDEKFTQTLGKLSKFTDAELVAFIRDAGIQFIDQIKSRSVKEGKLSSQAYGTLENHIRLCIECLCKLESQDPTNIAIIDSLLNLAIRGRYCGPEKANIAEQMAYSLVLGSEHPSLVHKLLGFLQIERMALQSLTLSILGKMFGSPRLHLANLANSVHPDFGLRRAAIDADDEVNAPLAIPMRALVNQLLLEGLFQRHTPAVVVRTIQDAAGTPSLTWGEITCWWEKWINEQECSDAERAGMQADLAQWKILGCDLVTPNGKLDPTIILAMLTAMGVIIPPKLEDQP